MRSTLEQKFRHAFCGLVLDGVYGIRYDKDNYETGKSLVNSRVEAALSVTQAFALGRRRVDEAARGSCRGRGRDAEREWCHAV